MARAATTRRSSSSRAATSRRSCVAKWLAAEPGVIVLDEPTRGVDVGAKHKLYSVIRSLAAEGLAVLLIASELIEVIGLADRIVVLHDGRIAGELPGGATEQEVMAYATGRRSS